MSNNSILAGLVEGECVDPHGSDVQLLAELACSREEICRELQEVVADFLCQVEWQAKGDDFIIYVLADHDADQDQLLTILARFLDERPSFLRFVETRLVQRSSLFTPRHGFSFVAGNPVGPRAIILAAGNHAFGSGNHPSTSLVIELLEELPVIPSPVLDVGCGTGILSLVSCRLGAGQVVGVDIDDETVAAAVENARINEMADRLTFGSAPLSEVEGVFPLILANLTGSVLYRLMDGISNKAAPEALLIVSGLQGRQGDEAETLAARYGWQLEKSRNLGKWQARVFIRSGA